MICSDVCIYEIQGLVHLLSTTATSTTTATTTNIRTDSYLLFLILSLPFNSKKEYRSHDILCVLLDIPKIVKWSLMGEATAISGKRQEMDSELARPTPTQLRGC